MNQSEADWPPNFTVRSKEAARSASFFVYEGEQIVASAALPENFRAALHSLPTLVVTDGDSTLIEQEVIDELAAVAGVGEEVSAITEAAMGGGLDFSSSLYARVALLEGLPVSTFDEVRSHLTLMPGARELIGWVRGRGAKFGVVSGGFTEVLQPLVDELGINFLLANHLEIKDGRLTGKILGPVVDAPAKVAALKTWSGGNPENAVAVGDGANDIPMLQAAGVGIAFCAKPVVRAEVESHISVPRLDLVIPLLGHSRSSNIGA